MLEFLHYHWRLIKVTLLTLGLGWIGLSALWFPPRSDLSPAPRPGFPAPSLTLDTLYEGSLNLEQIHARVIILNFWASWCPPCRAEMPVFEKLSREFNPAEVRFIGINATYQDNISLVSQFIHENRLTFTIALDREGQGSHAYQIQAFPTTFLLDEHKTIRSMFLGGPVPEAWLRAEIHRLLKTSR
ncbi:TlpA disulfide reductase family protein [uncultured Thermanaerothrix sp.]|uniref:TlpA family protein disulfide reductase n=1 Tax=uncultured Thermanaerothrix sp. TaxID=1195149 RepID=UPI0026219DCD|nr:TlpA disulfide reductase family protein [uncultured Thermanaerothrix sp.]